MGCDASRPISRAEPCTLCGKVESQLNVLRCTTCDKGSYCSADCRAKDATAHKKVCGKTPGGDASPVTTPESTTRKSGSSPASSPSKPKKPAAPQEEKKGASPKTETKKATKAAPAKVEKKGKKADKSFHLYFSLLDITDLSVGDEKQAVLVFDIDGTRRVTPKGDVKTQADWKHNFKFFFKSSHKPKKLKISLLSGTQFDATAATILKTKLHVDAEVDLEKAYKDTYASRKDETEEKKVFLDKQVDLKDKKGSVRCFVESQYYEQVIGQVEGADVTSPSALLSVGVVSGHKLISCDLLSDSDPFLMISLGSRTFRSKTIFNDNNPTFNYVVPIWVAKDSPDKTLKITCYDADLTSYTLIGSCFVDITTLKADKKYENINLPLHRVDPVTDADWSDVLRKEKTLITKLDAAPAKDGKSGDLVPNSLVLNFTLTPYGKIEEDFYTGLLDIYDSDKNGGLSYPELLYMLQVIGSKKTPDEVRDIFDKADSDGNGIIDKDELIKLVRGHHFHGEDVDKVLRSCMTKKDAHFRFLTQGLLEYHIPTGSNVDTSADSGDISVRERKTGILLKEAIPTYVKAAMKVFYRTSGGRETVETSSVRKLLRAVSLKQGVKMDSPASQSKIHSFIELHKLNVDEIERPISEYKTMNEFFFRKLKPGARPVSEPDNAKVALSPADCRLMVFETIEESKKLWIKGKAFTVEALLGPWGAEKNRADEFKNCSLVIARLAPQDYHRWHFPVGGVCQGRVPIEGEYNTVNPIAVRREVDVYTANKRTICAIESKEFGTVVLVAVAAAMVGSIRFECYCTSKDEDTCDGKCMEGKKVRKFDPHGYFAFGGSTVLLLFKAGSIKFDDDLVTNSKQQLETYIKVGDCIGRAVDKK